MSARYLDARTADDSSALRRILGWLAARRGSYLVGAICIALCTVMLLPLVFSVLASLKTTAEAAAVPPIYLPTTLSVGSYERLGSFQSGLPTYLINSSGVAL